MPHARYLVAAATIALLPTWTQAAPAPADHEAHHPAGAADSGPQAPDAAERPSGMMGGMSMMGRMQMMGAGPGMEMIDRVEGRIAFLRAELKISDAQNAVWNEFASALRTNAQNLAAASKAPAPQPNQDQPQGQTLNQRLDAEERWLAARLDGTRRIKAAFSKLFAALSIEQKVTADELLAPHMGLNMQAMAPRGPMRRGAP